MDKRQPLSVMIALQSKKMKGDKGGDAPAGPDDSKDDGGDDMKYDDPGLISACEDAIDAFKNRDPKALSAALGHFIDMYDPGKGDNN
jgi:hypothetical protein